MKIKYKHELRQAYWAGALTAKLHNIFYTRTDLPTIVQSMREFQHLKTLFSKYYKLLKNNNFSYLFVLEYEKFNRMGLKSEEIGDYSDFMIGYANFLKKEKI